LEYVKESHAGGAEPQQLQLDKAEQLGFLHLKPSATAEHIRLPLVAPVSVQTVSQAIFPGV